MDLNRFLILTLLTCNITANTLAQNSMTGDGFGGRLWYVAHNYQAGAYSAFTVCGDTKQLYGWGNNGHGELGNGSTISSTNPVAVLGMTNIKFYATGYLSAAIKFDHTAWVWGIIAPSLPSGFTTIPSLTLTNVKFVDAGTSHVVFIKSDSTVWGAGRNAGGKLGNGAISANPITVPVQMTDVSRAVRAIVVGETGTNAATIILMADGTVKVTGGGGWFQANNSTIPATVQGLNGIVDIKGNEFAAFALDSSGNVYAFGKEDIYPIDNPVPSLGLGANTGNFTPPTKLTFPVGSAPIVALSANDDGQFAMALDADKNVYAWGSNRYGELGNGSFTNLTTPQLVATNAIDIFAGETFSYILKADNTLWATGTSGHDNTYGSIWMNLPNQQRNIFTQIDPTIAPFNLCVASPYGVVPVSLINFICTLVGKMVELQWLAAEEINFLKYSVEYSKDGFNFTDIATIYSNGSNSKCHYFHQPSINTIAFYRLKLIDKNGSFKYSEIRSVKLNESFLFSIIPNPARDVVTIRVKNRAIINLVQILSMGGEILSTIKNYEIGQEIELNKLPKGSYILKIFLKDGQTEYGKFVKA